MKALGVFLLLLPATATVASVGVVGGVAWGTLWPVAQVIFPMCWILAGALLALGLLTD